MALPEPSIELFCAHSTGTGRYEKFEKLAVNQITCFNFNEYVEIRKACLFKCPLYGDLQYGMLNHELILSLTF